VQRQSRGFELCMGHLVTSYTRFTSALSYAPIRWSPLPIKFYCLEILLCHIERHLTRSSTTFSNTRIIACSFFLYAQCFQINLTWFWVLINFPCTETTSSSVKWNSIPLWTHKLEVRFVYHYCSFSNLKFQSRITADVLTGSVASTPKPHIPPPPKVKDKVVPVLI